MVVPLGLGHPFAFTWFGWHRSGGGVSGSVTPGEPPAGLVGIWKTRNVRLTRHDRFVPLLTAPSVIVAPGVSCTSPVVGFGAPRVNETPEHGAVLASPIADSTLKIPGSLFTPPHTDLHPSPHHASPT